jgi:hypothetical protein
MAELLCAIHQPDFLPVLVENSAITVDLAFHAGCWYLLISPQVWARNGRSPSPGWSWPGRPRTRARTARTAGAPDRCPRPSGSATPRMARACSRDRSARRGCAGSPGPGCHVPSPAPARGRPAPCGAVPDCGADRPVRPRQPRRPDLAPEHGNLMAQDQDLGVLRRVMWVDVGMSP